MRTLKPSCLLVLTFIAAAGCASTGGSSIPGELGTTRISTSDGTLAEVKLTPSGARESTAQLALPIEQVWRMLPAVYDSLGIPVTLANPATHLLGNTSLSLRRQLQGVLLHTYLDCGTTQRDYGADAYDVRAAITTRLTPSATGGTNVLTAFEAAARPMATAGNWVQCVSTGRLEQRLFSILSALLES